MYVDDTHAPAIKAALDCYMAAMVDAMRGLQDRGLAGLADHAHAQYNAANAAMAAGFDKDVDGAACPACGHTMQTGTGPVCANCVDAVTALFAGNAARVNACLDAGTSDLQIAGFVDHDGSVMVKLDRQDLRRLTMALSRSIDQGGALIGGPARNHALALLGRLDAACDKAR